MTGNVASNAKAKIATPAIRALAINVAMIARAIAPAMIAAMEHVMPIAIAAVPMAMVINNSSSNTSTNLKRGQLPFNIESKLTPFIDGMRYSFSYSNPPRMR